AMPGVLDDREPGPHSARYSGSSGRPGVRLRRLPGSLSVERGRDRGTRPGNDPDARGVARHGQGGVAAAIRRERPQPRGPPRPPEKRGRFGRVGRRLRAASGARRSRADWRPRIVRRGAVGFGPARGRDGKDVMTLKDIVLLVLLALSLLL